MAMKNYVWKGPPTAVEVWPDKLDENSKPHFSGSVAPGQPISVPLPDDNHQVQCWLAVKVIDEVVENSAVTALDAPIAAAADDQQPKKTKPLKEADNG